MRALILAPIFPEPVCSGGHTRLRSLVNHLGKRHQVHWLSLATPEQHNALVRLEGLAEPPEVVVARLNYGLGQRFLEALHPYQWARTAHRMADRVAGLPQDAIHVYFTEFAEKLRRVLQRHTFDVVQFEITSMGRYLPLVRRLAPRARTVLDELDLACVALERLADLPGSAPDTQRQAALMRRFEERLWRRCDVVVTMSEIDLQHVIRATPEAKVWTVPNGVDLDEFQFTPRAARARRLLFVGYFLHPPNVNAMRFFCREALPLVQKRFPDVELDIIGGEAPPDIRALHGCNGIRVHGFVPDVRPFLSECAATVVPIFSGGGTRLKILEAFAAGAPVVTTAIGCEGIEARDGEEALFAETAEDFVHALGEILADPARGQALALKARQLAERAYGWDAITRSLEDIWAHG